MTLQITSTSSSSFDRLRRRSSAPASTSFTPGKSSARRFMKSAGVVSFTALVEAPDGNTSAPSTPPAPPATDDRWACARSRPRTRRHRPNGEILPEKAVGWSNFHRSKTFFAVDFGCGAWINSRHRSILGPKKVMLVLRIGEYRQIEGPVGKVGNRALCGFPGRHPHAARSRVLAPTAAPEPRRCRSRFFEQARGAAESSIPHSFNRLLPSHFWERNPILRNSFRQSGPD